MTAVDTNVVVRLLAGDHARQERAARSLLARGQIWISKTVLLETSWVLRSLYGFENEEIRKGLTKLLGLRSVHAEDEAGVAAALALNTQGLDFADALHVTGRPRGAAFASFDRALVRRATRAGVAAVSGIPLGE